ncbi:terminase small subunit [Variovorax sp. PDNC026]|uniref:terminase small subunit n=1 Tax=Variovorax sp. PDNC026 TaxID=2811425 RepID=UPI001964A34C|nr:terminase small subunit [Variovorax sp. PDNC026]QRY31182.1 terminase small subunit [Variovorax sp. PDNC026]
MATRKPAKKPAPAPKKTTKPAAAPKKVAAAPARKKAPPAKAKPKKPSRKARPTPAAPVEPAQLGLTDLQQRFVDEYLVDLNGTQAAIRAGYSPDTARQMASENLSKPYIQIAIVDARKRQQARTHIEADRVVLEAWNIVFADPRELVQVKVGCCRHCWGEGFKFQRTVGEFNHDREQHALKAGNLADFDEKGGIGFDPLKPPHPACPDCGGDGYPRAVLADTRHLSPQARALYAGAKMTKYGIEIAMHDKAAFAEKLFKHLGLYEKDNQQKTDPLASLLRRISNGNANGFRPVADDPEAPATGAPSSKGMQPRQDVDGED